MHETSTEEEVREERAELAVQKTAVLDLTAYYNTELVKRFEETFSLVRLVPWMAGCIGGAVSIGLLTWYLVFYEAVATFVAAVLFIHVLVSFFYVGFALGLLLIVRRIFRKLVQILDIALAMVKQVAADLRNSGESPEMSLLFQKVMQALIIPAIRAVLAAKLGFLHRPVGWTVEKVLGRAARRLMKLVGRVFNRNGDAPPKEVDVDSRTSRTIARVGQGVDSTTQFLTAARDLADRSSGRIKFFALLPLQVIFFVCLSFAILPLLIAYWLAF